MTESNRCQIELRLSPADLHRALGPAGSPVTLAFSHDALTLTTPSRLTLVLPDRAVTIGRW